jgi:hypothetical protein
MLRERLDRFACALLDQVMRALAALRELAWLNRRMTAKGLASAAVFAAAHFGFHVSAETQVTLATALFLFLGLVGRDKQQRRSL